MMLSGGLLFYDLNYSQNEPKKWINNKTIWDFLAGNEVQQDF